MSRPRTALVIGGGIAGSATAIALQKAGVKPAVYEALPADADVTGVFLTIAPNGVDALKALHADAVVAAGFETPSITLRSSNGKHLGDTPLGRPPGLGCPSLTLKRAHLYQALQDEAVRRGVTVVHGKRLVAAEDTGDSVRAMFADGTDAFGDLLIGCDGVHSTVRRVIDPRAPAPTYNGLLNTAGYAHDVATASKPGRYEMIFARHAFFGYVTAPDGQVWWFANLPRRDEPRRGMREDVRARLPQLFADDAGPAVAIIEATPEIMPATPIHSIPRLATWHNRRMIVIGDACHAPSPSSGQGASLSIEDAVVLAKCLRDLPDPSTAFAEFEATRRPRVERIIKWATRVNSSKAAGPIGRLMRDTLLPTILRVTADSKGIRDMYDHHIEWDAPFGAPQ